MENTPTVYIVDDNDDHREILFQLVKRGGFDVKTFSSGIEFLSIEKLEGVGCIVLDNQMPHINGLQVQAELSNRECHLPIIFISGESAIAEAVQAVKDGALGFLEKPVQSKELMAWVEKAIEQCKSEFAHTGVRHEFESSLARLTAREKQVYDLVIRGRTNKMIATELDIKLGTVEFHRANMMQKMGANSFSELMELTHAANPLLKK